MKNQITLKIFGTGQVTIPKKWRESFNSNMFKAVFNEKSGEISLKPITLVELEDTQKISTSQLKKDLKNTKFSEKFQKELLTGYEKSDFYKSKLKK